MDWSDLRYFAAVGRTGSLAGGARELGVNHSTVFRRVNTLERALGVKLFERLPSGYVLTAAGEEMLAVASRVDDEITALDRRIAGRDYRLSGSIRITTTDTVGLRFVQPHLHGFHRAYPGIDLELIVSNAPFSLSRREADVAIRPTRSPPEELVGRRVSGLAWAVYASRSYLRGRPHPAAPADLAAHALVAGDDSLAQLNAARWLERHAPDARVVYRGNSLMTQLAAVREGFGVGVLPCFLADAERALVRVLPPEDALASELWLLTHADLRGTARVRALMEFLATAIAKDRPFLEGRGAPAGKPRAKRKARTRGAA